jgi:N-(2-amino-2-carboxyethyl)-L-glutamate synthase
MHDDILLKIGKTPLVKLSRVFKEYDFDLYAKLEGFNPGGSIKDRAALSIIRNALKTGEVGPGTTVVESSSGNMGIGLAQVCSYYGLTFVCVIDPKTTASNIEILKAYGAEIDYVSEPDLETGEYLPARIARVRELLKTIPGSYWPDQYSNQYNYKAHYETMSEIVTQLGRAPDYLFCAVSTCGTVRGCGEFVRNNELPTTIVGVDAVGSVIFGGSSTKRLIPGHGASVIPSLSRPELVDKVVKVTDLDCVIGCRRMAQKEAILIGGSSGAVLMAVDRLKETLEPGAKCVVIFADRGERYLDTIYSDSWVSKHFQGMTHLWQRQPQEKELVMAI